MTQPLPPAAAKGRRTSHENCRLCLQPPGLRYGPPGRCGAGGCGALRPGAAGGGGLRPHRAAFGGLRGGGVPAGGRHGIRGCLRHRRPGNCPPRPGQADRPRRAGGGRDRPFCDPPALRPHRRSQRPGPAAGGGPGGRPGSDHGDRRQRPLLCRYLGRGEGPFHRWHGPGQGGLCRHPGGPGPTGQRLPC